jgi:hypothetical protein
MKVVKIIVVINVEEAPIFQIAPHAASLAFSDPSGTRRGASHAMTVFIAGESLRFAMQLD